MCIRDSSTAMKLSNVIAATLVVLLTSFGGVSAQETQPCLLYTSYPLTESSERWMICAISPTDKPWCARLITAFSCSLSVRSSICFQRPLFKESLHRLLDLTAETYTSQVQETKAQEAPLRWKASLGAGASSSEAMSIGFAKAAQVTYSVSAFEFCLALHLALIHIS